MHQAIRTEIVINASKEKVWSILTTFENYPKWNPFIISLTGQLKEKSQLQATMLNGSKKFKFSPSVGKVETFKSFEWTGHLFIKGLFDGNHYFIIEEINKEQVNLIHGENFSGILSKWILKSIGNDTRLNFIKMNNALKQLAEN